VIDVLPKRVFLFSGHMVDMRGRAEPRFPPEREAAVTADIAAQLERLKADATALAICGGACGGDLIFAELMLARDARVDLFLPFAPSKFVKKSVDFANSMWRSRFDAVRKHAVTRTFVLPEARTAEERDASPYERNNLRMLESALGYGVQNVHFISVWDGREGDGPGGTGHMFEAVKSAGGFPEPPIDPLGSTQ
jgi:hypothetical protein